MRGPEDMEATKEVFELTISQVRSPLAWVLLMDKDRGNKLAKQFVFSIFNHPKWFA